AIVVREARKRDLDVFYSFRINDIHDSFLPDEMPTFKVEHPDWMIGERQYGKVTSFKTALNFAIPEVRELKFRVIEELFQKYDFDGLEIDFLRSSPYFLPGSESRHAHLLTALLQRVRTHLDRRGRQRGRPIRLAVRVNESLRSCRMDGYDVPAWIRDGLVDIVTLGSGVMDIELSEFRTLAAEKPVHIYPCLYGWPSRYSPIPAELATGLALNYHAQGADGIYLFNWFLHTRNNSETSGPYMAALLKQLGDARTLRTHQQRIMFATDRGRPQRAYQYNWLHCVLPESLPMDRPLETSMRVFATFQPETELTLKVQVLGLQQEDEVTVTVNRKPVTGWKRGGEDWLQARVQRAILRTGENHIGLQLSRRDRRSDASRTVAALELHSVRPSPRQP
ncbi:MAG: hypothetical protein VB858_00225, partial [Planctomycetaceae bacterium]